MVVRPDTVESFKIWTRNQHELIQSLNNVISLAIEDQRLVHWHLMMFVYINIIKLRPEFLMNLWLPFVCLLRWLLRLLRLLISIFIYSPKLLYVCAKLAKLLMFKRVSFCKTVGHGNVQTNPDKTQVIQDFSLPKSVRQLRVFAISIDVFLAILHPYPPFNRYVKKKMLLV